MSTIGIIGAGAIGSAFAKACGFKPTVDLAEGLKSTADWIRGIHA